MSLQVWLPLKGDLKNLGLDEITINDSGLIFDNDGKIGKALSMYGVPQKSFTIPSLVNAQIFSFSFWYKPIEDSSLTTNWRNIVYFRDVNTEGTSGSLRVQSSYGTVKDNYTISIDNSPTCSIVQAGIVYTKTWNDWCHVAFTCDGKTCNYYTNGELIKSGSCNGGKLTGIAYLGSGGSNNPNGLLNDFRIYDHCLSAKEVKLISQALVCHYPLNDFIGRENIICDTLKDSGKSHTSYGICDYDFTEQLVSGTRYTVSIKLTASSEKKSFAVYHSGGSYNLTPWINFNGSDFYTYIFTATSTHASLTGGKYGYGFARVYVTNNANQGQGTTTITGTANVEWIKIEKGSVATPWVPNASDALYSAMGFDGDTIYDCSGYGNDGAIAPSGVYADSKSARYSSCIRFDKGSATSGYIDAGTGGKVTDEITVSTWMHMGTWTANQHPFSCIEGGGWNIENQSSMPSFPVNVSTVGYKHTVNSSVTPKWTDLSSGWHLFTGTYDGYTVTLYIDGQPAGSNTTGSTSKLPIRYHASNHIYLHSEATGSGPSGSYDACKMSDFRIYATALSADDIKELYETSASVDNHGNMYAYEFNEL